MEKKNEEVQRWKNGTSESYRKVLKTNNTCVLLHSL